MTSALGCFSLWVFVSMLGSTMTHDGAVDSCSASLKSLFDFKLCNNARSSLNSTTTCTYSEYRGSTICDDRVISSDMCREVSLHMSNFSSASLMALVPTVDTDVSIRRISIKLSTAMHSLDFEYIGNEIDDFLVTRPWWYVSKEPYNWNQKSHLNRAIVIDRVHHWFERELRLLSNRQYRTAENCAKAPLNVGRSDIIHPGWFPVLSFYTNAQGHIPFSVFSIYVSYQNDPNDSPAFITGSDCPTILNKWECGFLKTTNCSLPKLLTDCRGSDCVRALPQAVSTTVLFDSASRDGNVVLPGSPEHKALKAMAREPIPQSDELKQWLNSSDQYPRPAEKKYLRPFKDSVPWSGFLAAGAFPFMRFIFRPNAFYRSHIARLLDRFFRGNSNSNSNELFGRSDRCVAAHVRRGDRIINLQGENVANMTEYCYKHRHDIGRITDLGCFNTPFASVTLRHILDNAVDLVPPEVRTLVLASDDEVWMVEEIRRMRTERPDWRVFFLESPKLEGHEKQSGDAAYHYMRSTGGTASGTFWWASIELARQCEGFVGHFGSGATMFFHKQLCEYHRDYENVCPPSFDVRSIPELKTHLEH